MQSRASHVGTGRAYASRYLLPASPRHDCGWGAACLHSALHYYYRIMLTVLLYYYVFSTVCIIITLLLRIVVIRIFLIQSSLSKLNVNIVLPLILII